MKNNRILFAGNSNLELAHEIAQYLGGPLGDAQVGRFNDGEIRIQIHEDIQNKNVFVIQSICRTSEQSNNDSLMELYLLMCALKKLRPRTINLVVPYYGYARQDKDFGDQSPISAGEIARLLELGGATHLITCDVHSDKVLGFFTIPVEHLAASSTFADSIAQKKLKHIVVVSPDAGGEKRADQLVTDLKKHGVVAGRASIRKERQKPGCISSMSLIGDVAGADTILVDDICDTCNTLVKAAQLLKDHGAHRVFVVVTHPVLSGDAVRRIESSAIEEMLVTNTIPLRTTLPSNIAVVSVASLLAHAIAQLDTQ